jgi:hypothetical protein
VLDQAPQSQHRFLERKRDMFKSIRRQLAYFFEMTGNILYCSFLNLLMVISLILLMPTLLVVTICVKIKRLFKKEEERPLNF